MKITFSVFAFVLAILMSGSLTTAFGQIVYKVPAGSLTVDWTKSGFKGQIFLNKDSPSGVFITFPDQGETSEELRERSAKFISPMVVSESKDKSFDVKNISSHAGDIADRGRYYFFKGEKSSVQILFFERKTPVATVLYGYFAQKGNNEIKSKIWVGDDLKDPKVLAHFIKSFVNK